MIRSVLLCCLLVTGLFLQAQPFTRQDSLRGTLTLERTWWDVQKYHIEIEPEFSTRTLRGAVKIQFKVIRTGKLMQVDLQQPMIIDTALWKGTPLSFSRDGNVYFIFFPEDLQPEEEHVIRMVYHGKPREATNPPWDGGWIWKRDLKGRPWMSVACQGLGASAWYPCKDHQSDEPDRGAEIRITVPDTLTAVANGRLKNTVASRTGYKAYWWEVKNPINNYNIVPYIGMYSHWHDTFSGENGNLDCDYWVLDYEVERARKHFNQVHNMLACFEYWFGPYPFYEDGYKLVQSPHLGMEHQSGIAYGNGFQNGYLGRDLSESGWGLKWDFIIVHESGHEWFGNNITTQEIADMWVHEGFTNYSEALFTECEYGVEAGTDYVSGIRKLILNDRPVIGTYHVNREGSGDMYFKGSNLIHMIRTIINDDKKFRSMLREMNDTFHLKLVTTTAIEDFISKRSGTDFSKIFDQYLRTTQIPVLEYKIKNKQLSFRWTNCLPGFNMPVRIKLKDSRWITPSEMWQTTKVEKSNGLLQIDRNFYATARMSNAR